MFYFNDKISLIMFNAIIFVEGFDGYVFAHIVCGSGSKPGGI